MTALETLLPVRMSQPPAQEANDLKRKPEETMSAPEITGRRCKLGGLLEPPVMLLRLGGFAIAAEMVPPFDFVASRNQTLMGPTVGCVVGSFAAVMSGVLTAAGRRTNSAKGCSAAPISTRFTSLQDLAWTSSFVGPKAALIPDFMRLLLGDLPKVLVVVRRERDR